MSVAELQDGFLRLVKVLYSDEETKARRHKFRRMLKFSSNARRGPTGADKTTPAKRENGVASEEKAA
jgi:hypothetical protein